MTDTVNPTASAPASATAVLPDDFLTPVEAAGRLRISKAALYERIGMAFYVFESHSTNQHGAEVCRGSWTQIVRPRP